MIADRYFFLHFAPHTECVFSQLTATKVNEPSFVLSHEVFQEAEKQIALATRFINSVPEITNNNKNQTHESIVERPSRISSTSPNSPSVAPRSASTEVKSSTSWAICSTLSCAAN